MADFIDVSGDYRLQPGLARELLDNLPQIDLELMTTLDGGIQISIRKDKKLNDYVVMLTNLEVPFNERYVYCMHGQTPMDCVTKMLAWVAIAHIEDIYWSENQS